MMTAGAVLAAFLFDWIATSFYLGWYAGSKCTGSGGIPCFGSWDVSSESCFSVCMITAI